MHGPSPATLIVAIALGLAPTASLAGSADAIAEARRKLEVDDGIAAVGLLEAALPEAGERKEVVLDLLRKAYDSAARQAKAAGRAEESETYNENLKILTRKSRPVKASPILPTRIDAEPGPRSTIPVESAPGSPAPLPDGPAPLPAVPHSNTPSSPIPMESAGPPLEASVATESASPPPMPMPEPTAERPSLASADSAFVAKDYRAAGRIYGELAEDKKLPPERNDQWLYCRAADVVARINARPKDEAGWASIQAEIAQIRALNPKNYLGEYLKDLASERQSGRRKTKASKALVVRGSAPEEPPVVERPVKPASNIAKPLPVANPATAPRAATAVGRWQVFESANFRIYHADPKLAAKVAEAAEAARRDQLKRWSRPSSEASWLPPCEVYLYPTAKQYAVMTGQPEESPGFSTMGMNGGRIISRRINLRADHPTLVQAVLPHEITHAILADHFTQQQIPRWADEGMAVLSEPVDEQQRRAADLVKPLAENRVFALDMLMSMDYPEERHWNLYYAQSVSLTRFLVEQGTPARMIQFLQEAQRDGYEPALRKIYRIEGFPDLQRRWVAYARTKVESRNIAASPTADGPDLKVR